MKISTCKIIIALLLSCTFLFRNVVNHYSLAGYRNDEIFIEKVDSTQVKKLETQILIEESDKKTRGKSDAHLTYKLFFYLVTKFLESNPLARPNK